MKKIVLGVLGILGKEVLQYLHSRKEVEILGVASATDREGQYDCYNDILKLGLPLVELEELQKLRPDIYINVSYPKILSKEFVTSCLAVNLHAAKLPEYRGRSVYTHMIQNNESTACTTIHLMTEEVDRGDIIAEKQTRIELTETARDLYDRMQKISMELFEETFPKLLDGTYSTRKQVGEGHYYKKELEKELDLKEDPFKLYNKIRSLDFYPYEPAYYIKDGIKKEVRLRDVYYDFACNSLTIL